MITHPAFEVRPWAVHETALDLDALARTESLFALSNGHIGVRGNLDEGEPHGIPGTYLNSVHELRPLPYAEAGYGYPESGETIVNVTNGKLIRLLVDDEPLDVRYGTLRSHERTLDLRTGTLTRQLEWCSPAGNAVRVRSERLVSFTQRAIVAIRYEVEALDRTVRLVVQSELVANESIPGGGGDPRTAAILESPLLVEENASAPDGAVLVHVTKGSQLRVGAGMRHEVTGPGEVHLETDGAGDVARVTVTARIAPGERLTLVKYLGYGWSARRSRPAVHDQVVGALSAAATTGWDGLLREQREYLDEFWSGADVEVEGDAEVQQAVRFALFHVLQAGARGECRPIPAKGLTGPGYDGHTFWDTEMFVLPVLTYTSPAAAADVLRWRHRTLPSAQRRAAQLGRRGAAFPWRTISGQECSAYWPAGTAAFHINADIAHAVVRYLEATGDREFERETAIPLLVATARLWRDLGHHDVRGRFRIDGVTGPDEYSAVADNNVYTNLLARQNLNAAADLAVRHPDRARDLEVGVEEVAQWRDAAAAVYIPFDERLGVHPANEGFTEHAVWDFAATTAADYPLLLHYPYFELYRKQVVKQADLVLAMHACPDAFTAEQKVRNFAYYEALTVRDSSLSACTQAVLAAEVGQVELAYDYLGEAALMDLNDLEHNTRDGVHIASLAGTWVALVSGLGGMRVRSGQLSFAPRLPSDLTRLCLRLRFLDRRLEVDIRADDATYRLLDGEALTVVHHGATLRLGADPVSRPIPPISAGPRPQQPPGREPARRGPGD
ncbi:glycoside hydrolase family 65 protein [Nocardia sp. BMG111209]|uniref:glycoside hydrolase family 65 protein n=1 Tax=Nocardia sp. BMG111209 TaxID=1160137 RepID=UPI0003604D84|nr:glycosyl hydrolase family 65 protein [Nocardia sp. BMG111209]